MKVGVLVPMGNHGSAPEPWPRCPGVRAARGVAGPRCAVDRRPRPVPVPGRARTGHPRGVERARRARRGDQHGSALGHAGAGSPDAQPGAAGQDGRHDRRDQRRPADARRGRRLARPGVQRRSATRSTIGWAAPKRRSSCWSSWSRRAARRPTAQWVQADGRRDPAARPARRCASCPPAAARG